MPPDGSVDRKPARVYDVSTAHEIGIPIPSLCVGFTSYYADGDGDGDCSYGDDDDGGDGRSDGGGGDGDH